MNMRVDDTAVILAGLSVPVLGGVAFALNALGGDGEDAGQVGAGSSRGSVLESRPTASESAGEGGPSWPVTVVSNDADASPTPVAEELEEATRQLGAARDLLEAERARHQEAEAQLADARDARAEIEAPAEEELQMKVAEAEQRLSDAEARLREEIAQKEDAEAAAASAAEASRTLKENLKLERESKGKLRWALEGARQALRSKEERLARAELLLAAAEARSARADAQRAEAARHAARRQSDAAARLREERARTEVAEAALAHAAEANHDLEDKFELEQDSKAKTRRELERAQGDLRSKDKKLARLEAFEAKATQTEAELREERGSLRKLGKRMWSLSKERVKKRFRRE